MKNILRHSWLWVFLALFIYSCDLINKDSRLTPNMPADGTVVYTTPKNGVIMNLLSVQAYQNASAFRIARQPANGKVSFIKDATLLYTPDTTKTISSDSFVLSITTDSLNNTSVLDTVIIKFVSTDSIPCSSGAVADGYVTYSNSAIRMHVLENDSFCQSNIDSTSLQITRTTEHGTLAIQSDHRIVYTPNANYVGYDFFIYKICTSNGECAEAPVKIWVQSSSGSTCDGAHEDTYTFTNDSIAAHALDLLANDRFCNDSINYGSFAIVRQPAHGQVSIGKSLPPYVTYQPTAGYSGSDSFRYRLCSVSGKCSEAEVKITIDSTTCTNVLVSDTLIYKVTYPDTLYANSARINVVANDKINCPIASIYQLSVAKQPAHGKAYISGGFLYYVPTTGYKGTDTLEYGICLIGNAQSCQQRATVFIDIP